MFNVVVAVMATLASVQQTDTVITVRPGVRVELENFGGETVVRTWDRNAVRIVADHSSRDRIEIHGSETAVHIEGQSRFGPPRSVDYQLTVPVKSELNISGVYNDVNIDGVKGGITVETVQGDVDVKGGEGFVSLRSVEGHVSLSGARGRVQLNSVNEEVTASDVVGDLSVETVNGDVILEKVESANVDANTVNGEIWYDGTIKDGGHYTLTTHNGDITVTVAEGSNVTVSVATFSGDFESAFPVRLTETRRKRFNFALGSGSARLDLESFQGTIRLERPGVTRSVRDRDDDDHEREREREQAQREREREKQRRKRGDY